ncbi:MAG: J domain-containing protein [Ruminococcus sp.]|nr:J domain-containing protein [Ruminococcus sp.]
MMKCDICGQKTYWHSVRKKDDRYICRKCRKWFPSVLRIQDYSFSQVSTLIDYEKKHGRNFCCTSHAGTLYLDETARKIAYSKSGTDSPKHKNNVFCIRDLKDISVTLSEPVVINENIYCDILLTVVTERPVNIVFTRVVRHRVPCRYDRVDSSTVKFREPPEILIIRNMLIQMLSDNVTELKNLLLEQQIYQQKCIQSEVREAEILLMLDTGYTADDVKSHYRIMMKSFHPDRNSEIDDSYAQKINNAYEILKQRMKGI